MFIFSQFCVYSFSFEFVHEIIVDIEP